MDKSPDAFRTISEVAEELDVPQHVLRFWETRFSQIRPMKRAGGRRYYRPNDVDLLRGIRALLYDEGYTIKGVQKILREQGNAHVIAIGRGEAKVSLTAPQPTSVSGGRNRARPAEGPADSPPAAGGSPLAAGRKAEEELRLALSDLAAARRLLKGILPEEA